MEKDRKHNDTEPAHEVPGRIRSELARRAFTEVEEANRDSAPALDRRMLYENILEIADKIGIDVDEIDLEFFDVEVDDEGLLGYFVGLGQIHGIDPERMLEILGLPVEYLDSVEVADEA